MCIIKSETQEKTRVCKHCSANLYNYISKLSEEILLRIIKLLNVKDLLSLSWVCKSFRRFAGNNEIWKHIYASKWSLLPRFDNDYKCCWKRLYFERIAKERKKPLQSTTDFLELDLSPLPTLQCQSQSQTKSSSSSLPPSPSPSPSFSRSPSPSPRSTPLLSSLSPSDSMSVQNPKRKSNRSRSDFQAKRKSVHDVQPKETNESSINSKTRSISALVAGSGSGSSKISSSLASHNLFVSAQRTDKLFSSNLKKNPPKNLPRNPPKQKDEVPRIKKTAKLVVVGGPSAGKTAVIFHFVYGFFQHHDPTLAAAHSKKDLEVPGGLVSFSIWDLSGQPRV
eukprot:TRINITY_DN4903_c0_g1_i2.p1 TRINITY_DN4903_c0_g1~~TRINITY_DN4903_c0_g1_i2.p1  ORF type:complete len:337 (-),score=68.29 TRINITY_DN4903_c0_g1_i2:548-1558(-)